jgi:uncharacterized membrane protein YjfL (UPF0719 family)
MQTVYTGLFALATAIGMLALVRVLNSALRLIVGKKGSASRAIVEASQTISVLVACGAVVGGSAYGDDLRSDAMWVAISGAISAALLVVLGRVSAMTLVGGKANDEIARGNLAASVAVGAHQIAIGVLLAHCIYGRDLGSLGVAIVFFAIGLVTLHLLVLTFRALTAYDDAQEILGENLAASMSYAGVMIGIAIVIGHAADGTFEGWRTSLVRYAAALGLVLLLYPIRQLVVQSLVLGEPLRLKAGGLDARIARERDLAAAFVESGAYIATALMAAQL